MLLQEKLFKFFCWSEFHFRLYTGLLQTKHDLQEDILDQNKILPVLELFITELVIELFQQLRLEAPTYFEKLKIPTSKFTTR